MELVSKRRIARGFVLAVAALSAVMLAMALVAAPAYAASSFTYQGLKCTKVDGGLSVTPAKKNAKKVTVPARIKGKKVVEFWLSHYDNRTEAFVKYKLKKIDLENAKNLRWISLDGTEITSLDLSKCKKLKSAYVRDNAKLKTIEVGHLSKLKVLDFCDCNVKKINVAKCPQLKELWCGNNLRLSSLNVSRNTKLVGLFAWSCKLKTLNLAKNVNLKKLQCSQNGLTSLDLSKCVELKSVACANNELTSLVLPSTTKLTEVKCFNNKLNILDLRGCRMVSRLNCSNNNLTAILIMQNHVYFTELDYSNNNIADTSQLDVRYSG